MEPVQTYIFWKSLRQKLNPYKSSIEIFRYNCNTEHYCMFNEYWKNVTERYIRFYITFICSYFFRWNWEWTKRPLWFFLVIFSRFKVSLGKKCTFGVKLYNSLPYKWLLKSTDFAAYVQNSIQCIIYFFSNPQPLYSAQESRVKPSFWLFLCYYRMFWLRTSVQKTFLESLCHRNVKTKTD